jgi:predicted DNA-binding WGR domain protein
LIFIYYPSYAIGGGRTRAVAWLKACAGANADQGFPDDVAAGKHAAKLIEEKLGKGYVEVK